MKKQSYVPGEPCWIDCGTDLDKGPSFYAALLGWDLEDLGEGAGGYRMASKGGGYVAGFGPQQSPGPPYWNVYFRTDDANKAAEPVPHPVATSSGEHMPILAIDRRNARRRTGLP